MRKYDKEKDKRLKDALISLSAQEGLASLTTAKIAKKAGISPATIYLRYTSKEDLISRIYEEVKTELHSGIAEAISTEATTVDQLRALILFSIKKTVECPQESDFVRQASINRSLLDEAAQNFVEEENGAIAELMTKLDQSPAFVYPNRESLEALLAFPSQVFEQNPNQELGVAEALADMAIAGIYKGEWHDTNTNHRSNGWYRKDHGN